MRVTVITQDIAIISAEIIASPVSMQPEAKHKGTLVCMVSRAILVPARMRQLPAARHHAHQHQRRLGLHWMRGRGGR